MPIGEGLGTVLALVVGICIGLVSFLLVCHRQSDPIGTVFDVDERLYHYGTTITVRTAQRTRTSYSSSLKIRSTNGTSRK